MQNAAPSATQGRATGVSNTRSRADHRVSLSERPERGVRASVDAVDLRAHSPTTATPGKLRHFCASAVVSPPHGNHPNNHPAFVEVGPGVGTTSNALAGWEGLKNKLPPGR